MTLILKNFGVPMTSKGNLLDFLFYDVQNIFIH